MHTKLRGLSAAALALIIAGCAQPPAKPVRAESKWETVPPTPVELAEIAKIEAVGHEIYRQDQLAWHASDALLAQHPKVRPAKDGWVITNEADGSRVTFIEQASTIRIIGDVIMPADGPPRVTLDPARTLDDTELRMFHARQTALHAAKNVCGGPMNTTIVPSDDGNWDVYVLAATPQPNVVPLGGHSRVRVSADGLTAITVEPYSKSCMMMDISSPKVIELVASHIVSELPAPTHVFLSLTYPKPIDLATRTHFWRVADGRITTIK